MSGLLPYLGSKTHDILEKFLCFLLIFEMFNQAHSQDRFWGGARLPKCGPFGPKKCTFWTHPLNPPTKTPFLAHFVTKSGPFSRFGVVCRTPPPPATGLCSISYISLSSMENSLISREQVLNAQSEKKKWQYRKMGDFESFAAFVFINDNFFLCDYTGNTISNVTGHRPFSRCCLCVCYRQKQVLPNLLLFLMLVKWLPW